MNIWNAFPFVRYSVALIAGILVADQFPRIWDFPWPTGSVLFAFVLLSAILRNKYIDLIHLLSGVFNLSLIAYLGGFLLLQHDQKNQPFHLSQIDGRVAAFSGMIVSDNFEREKYQRYTLQLNHTILDDQIKQASGLLYLYVRKDSSHSIIPYGTQLHIKGAFYEISRPSNPDQFDYQRYLSRKKIYAQSFVGTGDIQEVGHKPPNLFLNYGYRIRGQSSQMIADFIPGSDEAAVLNALLLGVKDFLDNDIKKAYSAAGAMHVLAVSGLHVGIVYLLITLIFGQLKRKLWGRIAFLLISLMTIWSYALITGFSASVMRAATMFSVIALGESFKRKGNIYNSLGLAAFILLLYDPLFVFDVGFQLSFVAVLGIVTFQPPIYKLWQPSHKVLDYLWAIISVSLAAQLVTFPLSIHYFNQLPTYFLLSNLIVIPGAMVMLTTGLFMLMLGSMSDLLGETIGFLLSGFVELINWLVTQIQSLPSSTIDWISLSAISVLLIYLLMIYGFFGLRHKRFQLFAFALICVALLMSNLHYEKFSNLNQKRIVVYHDQKHLVVDLIKGKESRIVTTSTIPQIEEMASFNIDPHRLSSGLQAVSKTPVSLLVDMKIKGLYFDVWEGQKIMVMAPESSGKFDKRVETDLLIVQSYCPDLVDSVETRHLILSQMSWNDRHKMINYLEQQKTDYFDMFERGYFELDLQK